LTGVERPEFLLDHHCIFERTIFLSGESLLLRIVSVESHRNDIDLENRIWTLANAKTRDKRTRNIAITNQIKQDIEHFLETRPESEYPFEIATVDGMSRFIRRWLKKAGIAGKKAHSLRHTFATQVVNNGNYSVRDAQLVLGHSTVTVTEGYVHDRVKPKPIEIDLDV